MDDVSDMQKDRAIAERIGHVWQNFNSPGWCAVTWYSEDEGGPDVERVEWPSYDDPEAFVHLLGRLQEEVEVGYVIASSDINGMPRKCAKITYRGEDGRINATRKQYNRDAMAALRDAVFEWVRATSD
jgi:hypothetical protein